MIEHPGTRSDALSHYALQRPTHALVLESLERYLGEEEATEVWFAACALVEIDPNAEETPAHALLKAVDALDASDRLVATCATGLRIRLMSYMILAEKHQGASPAVRS